MQGWSACIARGTLSPYGRCTDCLHACRSCVKSTCCRLMWLVMQDPVDSSPAVLVKRYNVTQQKELELQLSDQQEALQRCADLSCCFQVNRSCPKSAPLHAAIVRLITYGLGVQVLLLSLV